MLVDGPGEAGSVFVEQLEQRRLLSAATLVKDIYPGTIPSTAQPQVVVDGEIFFTYSNRQLGKTDGTAENTERLTSVPFNSGSVSWVTAAHDRVFFSINDGTHGYELWSSDGTQGGTSLVKDFNPGAASSTPTPALEVERGVVFGAFGVTPGLWFSDGTETGTFRLSESVPSGNMYSTSLTPFNGNIYYMSEGEPGIQLWRTDGTLDGTEMIIDLAPSLYTSSRDPHKMRVAGGLLYFDGIDAEHGRELWVTDGTGAGTRRITDSVAGPEGSHPRQFTSFSNGLAFFAEADDGRGLFFTDGTTVTRLFEGWITGAAALGDHLLFAGTTTETGRELWISDGTLEGTTLLVDLREGTEGSAPSGLITFNNRLYFTADLGPGRGTEIWSTDATAAGTSRLADINPDGNDIFVNYADNRNHWYPLVVGDQLVFQADDGLHGSELWTTDGTGAGTRLLVDVYDIGNSSTPEQLTPDGAGKVYFTARTRDEGRALWVSDGTEAGTQLVHDLSDDNGYSPEEFAFIGESLYFVDGYSIYRTDGTSAGTTKMAEGDTITAVGDTLFFFRFNISDQSRSLWKIDDGAGSSEVLAEVRLDQRGSPVAANGLLLFLGYDGSTRGLWKSDGTPEGTRMVREVPAAYPGGDHLVTTGSRVFFRARSASDYSGDYQLWVSDGTETGTMPIFIAQPGQPGSYINLLTAVGTNLYYVARGEDSPNEIWTSDGTAEGTRQVTNLFSAAITPSWGPRDLTAAGGYLYFEKVLADGNIQLWRTDGTDVGTLATAEFPGDTTPLLSDGEVLYFTADDGTTGPELWVTDGTPGNARLFDDTNPGAGGSRPTSAATLGDRLLLNPADRTHGRELFALPPADFAPPMAVEAAFDFERRQALTFVFSERVVDSLSVDDLVVVDESTGQNVPSNHFALGIGPDDATPIWTYDIATHGPLPDGNYQATLPAGSVTDTAGNALAEDATLDFFVLAGDANRDRVVSLADFLILRSNFGQSGKVFSEGDFNYDGQVSLADFLILRSNFGVSLPPPPSASPLPRLFAGGGKDDEEDGGRRNVALLR